MRKPENTFISSVHKKMPAGEPHAEKMANPYRGGTWDVWYSGTAADLWIEYKYLPTIPVRAAVLADLSALQLQWGKARYEEGRNLAVIIGCKAGGIILRDLAWEKEIPPSKFTALLLSRDLLAQWIATQTMKAVNASICHKGRSNPLNSTSHRRNLRGADNAGARSGR